MDQCRNRQIDSHYSQTNTYNNWDSWKWFDNLYHEKIFIERLINLFLYGLFWLWQIQVSRRWFCSPKLILVRKAANIRKVVQGGKLFCKLQLLNSLLIVVLWTGCFGTWVQHLTRRKVDPRIWTDYKLFYFLFYFGRHYSSMLLVMMSIEKCFTVYFPLKSKTVCTVKTAKWATRYRRGYTRRIQ